MSIEEFEEFEEIRVQRIVFRVSSFAFCVPFPAFSNPGSLIYCLGSWIFDLKVVRGKKQEARE